MTRPPQSALGSLWLACAAWGCAMTLAGCVTASADWGTTTTRTTATDPKTGMVTVVEVTDHRRKTNAMDNRTGAALASGLFGGLMDQLGTGGLATVGLGGLGIFGLVGKMLHTNATLKGKEAGYTQAQVETAGLAPAQPAAPAATGAVA